MAEPGTMAERWREVARVVADGVAVTEGEIVGIFLTDHESFAAVEAFAAEVYRRGAHPHVILTDERLDRVALELSDAASLARVPVIEAESMRLSDVHVSFRGMVPPDRLDESDAFPAKLAAQRKAKGVISGLRWQETRWAIVRVPTLAWARYRGIDPDVLFDEFFAGCTLDWQHEREAWKELADRLNRTEVVRIVAPDTDLSLRVGGRTAVVFAGEANWPDGEVATAPLDHGVDGYITFADAFTFASATFSGLRLEFRDGAVVSVSAAEGEEVARALLDTDDGSRRVGELGIGLNPSMSRWTGDLLLDEKILGTVHIALGRAYPECGGTNRSSLHWDIVKDLRPGSAGGAGSIYFDGEPVILDGSPVW